VDVAVGEHLYGKAHGYFGASTERTGFLVEGIHLRSDGFKHLYGDGGGNTGFARNEWMLKARHMLDPSATVVHEFNVKLGYSDESSDETYLGLTDEDLRADPLLRYRASEQDHMAWRRTQLVVDHRLRAGTLKLTTTFYRHDLARTWRKVNGFRGAILTDVLADPDSPRNEIFMGVLRGELDASTFDEAILIGPNQRTFVSQGLQSVARGFFETGPVSHNVEVGARWHYDRAVRLHSEEGYLMQGGALVPDGRGIDVTADNQDSTHAVALHALDALAWKRLALTPGVRTELVRSRSLDRLDGSRGAATHVVVIPGMGAYYALTQQLGALAGAYKGFSPPAPGQPEAVKPEESINYEAGIRYSHRKSRVELIGFFNDYSNLTSICTFSSGCNDANVDRQFDAGRAHIYGLEAYAEHELRTGFGVNFPVSFAYTLTQARFLDAFNSEDPQFGRVQAGDELPYVPMHQLAGSVGAETQTWSINAGGTFVDRMREEAGQGELREGEATDRMFVLDVSAGYRFLPKAQIYLNVRNALDSHAIVSRRPFGARPNSPRWVQLGLKWSY
ncbi:MAG: TonB-dependent receptor, partial [Myxococcaceae bacterium]|nr:TonB-dependent receptor [Myxococcaceae bacterium]